MPIFTCEERTPSDHGPCTNRVASFEGAVIDTFERNGHDDSDFYAVVWDADAGVVTTRMYGTTRGWTYHNGVQVDATEDALAKAEAWLAGVIERDMIARAEKDATTPAKGKTVRSLTTRGKNAGLVAEVKWYGVDDYRSNRWNTYHKVGVKVAGEAKLRYIDADRVEVVDPAPVDLAAIAELARAAARYRRWRSAFTF